MLNNQSDDVVSAVTLWARIIQIGGSILGAIIIFVGFIDANDGEYTVLLSILTGITLIISSNIISLMLRLLVFIAENTSDCASSMRSCKYHIEEYLMRGKREIVEKEDKKECSSKPQVTISAMPQEKAKPKVPDVAWVCSYCGANNLPCDNICNNCGQKKVD